MIVGALLIQQVLKCNVSKHVLHHSKSYAPSNKFSPLVPEKEFDFKSNSYFLLQKSVMYINNTIVVQF